VQNPESYKDGAIEQIAKLCESVTPEDAEIIGDVILNMMTQFKADLIDEVGVDLATSVKDRVNLTLSRLRSA
jgi:hypothetical protein